MIMLPMKKGIMVEIWAWYYWNDSANNWYFRPWDSKVLFYVNVKIWVVGVENKILHFNNILHFRCTGVGPTRMSLSQSTPRHFENSLETYSVVWAYFFCFRIEWVKPGLLCI